MKQIINNLLRRKKFKDDKLKPIYTEIKVPSFFNCTICLQMFKKPVVTSCYHVFCDKCLQRWNRLESKCPLCRKTIHHHEKTPLKDFERLCSSILIKEEKFLARNSIEESSVNLVVDIFESMMNLNFQKSKLSENMQSYITILLGETCALAKKIETLETEIVKKDCEIINKNEQLEKTVKSNFKLQLSQYGISNSNKVNVTSDPLKIMKDLFEFIKDKVFVDKDISFVLEEFSKLLNQKNIMVDYRNLTNVSKIGKVCLNYSLSYLGDSNASNDGKNDNILNTVVSFENLIPIFCAELVNEKRLVEYILYSVRRLKDLKTFRVLFCLNIFIKLIFSVFPKSDEVELSSKFIDHVQYSIKYISKTKSGCFTKENQRDRIQVLNDSIKHSKKIKLEFEKSLIKNELNEDESSSSASSSTTTEEDSKDVCINRKQSFEFNPILFPSFNSDFYDFLPYKDTDFKVFQNLKYPSELDNVYEKFKDFYRSKFGKTVKISNLYSYCNLLCRFRKNYTLICNILTTSILYLFNENDEISFKQILDKIGNVKFIKCHLNKLVKSGILLCKKMVDEKKKKEEILYLVNQDFYSNTEILSQHSFPIIIKNVIKRKKLGRNCYLVKKSRFIELSKMYFLKEIKLTDEKKGVSIKKMLENFNNNDKGKEFLKKRGIDLKNYPMNNNVIRKVLNTLVENGLIINNNDKYYPMK